MLVKGVPDAMSQSDTHTSKITTALLTLQWHHNEQDGVSYHSYHWRLDCLLNRLNRRRSKKTSKLCITGLWEGNPPLTGGFPSQKASNMENVSIWWHHHEVIEEVWDDYGREMWQNNTNPGFIFLTEYAQPTRENVTLLHHWSFGIDK